MRFKIDSKFFWVGVLCFSLVACSVPTSLIPRKEKNTLPEQFSNNKSDSSSIAKIKWHDFFSDEHLKALVDTALKNNQELNIVLQEINIAKNEVRARKGEYLPFMNIEGGAGIDRMGRFTRPGVIDATQEIEPGQKFPDPLPDFLLAANFSWQVDIWKKLRNAKKSAMFRYLSSMEGKNFLVTHLVAEIANSYYELMALDNQLDILRQNIKIQQDALEIVKLEKQAARVTELAVRRFEAEVLKNQSRQFYISQQIIQTENRINFLVGRFPQPISRNSATFANLPLDSVNAGVPSQLLALRPDIRQAELNLAASKLDVKVARANFYPSLDLSAGVGFEAFKAAYLISKPESMFYTLAAGLTAPVINRNAIKAYYYSANAKQIQAVYEYEQTILKAFIEVTNQLSAIKNLERSYALRSQQVQALTQSIDISTRLFRSARADYMEVLLTQRDALESKFELIETKKQQLNARINVYQALGGGWN